MSTNGPVVRLQSFSSTSAPPFGYASVPMSTQATWELLARCREVATQLRDIGEEQHEEDVTTLIAMVIECQGHH